MISLLKKIIKLYLFQDIVKSDEKKSIYKISGILPLPKKIEGVKNGVCPESFKTLKKLRNKYKIEPLTDEQIKKISEQAVRKVADMKLVTGTFGMNKEELEVYYAKVGVKKITPEESEKYKKMFNEAFKKALNK